MKRIAIITALLVALATTAVFALSRLHDRSCYQNTLYSASFSREAFARIAVGTSRADVVASLGAPLDARTDPSYPASIFGDEVARRYGSRTNIAVEFLHFSQPKDRLHDYHWVSVCVGPDATVVGTSSYITD